MTRKSTNFRIIGTSIYGRVKASERPKTYAEGRVCAASDCLVKLSVYNSDDHCFVHRQNRRRRTRGKTEEERARRKPRCMSCSARVRKLTDVEKPLEVMIRGIVHREGHEGAATLCETW